MAGNKLVAPRGKTARLNKGVWRLDGPPSPRSSVLSGCAPGAAPAPSLGGSLRSVPITHSTVSQVTNKFTLPRPLNNYKQKKSHYVQFSCVFKVWNVDSNDNPDQSQRTKPEKNVLLTHNHDVCVGQKGSVCVGSLALIDGAVGRLCVV